MAETVQARTPGSKDGGPGRDGLPESVPPKCNDRRYGGRFVLKSDGWWATLGSNQ
jgi:hypothetical protein